VAPAIGGLLIDHFGWQAVFLMSLPFCALAWPSALRYLPNEISAERHDFDWNGTAALFLMTVSLLGFASTIRGGLGTLWWSGSQVLLALASLAWFLRHARSHSHAIVKLAVFAHKPAIMGLIVSFVFGFGVYGSSYLIPVYLQSVLGLSATQSGGVLVPGGVVLAISMPIAGWLADHSQPRLISVTGLLLFALSFFGMWYYSSGISYLALLLLTVLGRIGISLLSASLIQAARHGLHVSLSGQLAMLMSYVRMLGGFLGIALIAVFVEWRAASLGSSGLAGAQAYNEGFLLSAIIMLLAMVAAWRMKAD
jgi:predicted MFS family arabinose efflux permease